MDGNNAMPLPFVAEDIELSDRAQGSGRIEIGEPNSSLEKADGSIGVSTLRQHPGGSDERFRVVISASRACARE